MRWLPESEVYKQACLRLSKDMTNFKTDPEYVRWVGNDNRGPEIVEAFDKVVKLPYVHENDRIGNPRLHNGKSAGTLRYMKVVQDTIDWDIESVVEVGAGYGGQCLVMNRLRKAEYVLIDIWEALELCAEYLEANKLGYPEDFKTLGVDYVPWIKCDLLISDYCLSELDNDGIDFYLSRIKSKYVHVACNSQGKRREYLISRLAERYTLSIEPENPKTSKHENIVIYGVAGGIE